MTDHAGLGNITRAQRVAFGDVDNDGDQDLYVMRRGRDALYRNDGGRLVRVERSPVVEDAFSSLGGAWGDYDGDGDLDLHAWV